LKEVIPDPASNQHISLLVKEGQVLV